MLMQLGPVSFDMKVNPQSTGEQTQTPFATHEVVGAAPLYEFMGDGPSTFTITGVIHPEHFGGYSGLAALESARAGHIPVPLMRGTLEPVGWFLVTALSRQDEELNEVGIGRVINFTVSLTRTNAPGSDIFASILNLLQ